ncbi:hypothetical protein GGI42DRAFT_169683 [Trichoderma sp. SZMC 28013]
MFFCLVSTQLSISGVACIHNTDKRGSCQLLHWHACRMRWARNPAPPPTRHDLPYGQRSLKCGGRCAARNRL